MQDYFKQFFVETYRHDRRRLQNRERVAFYFSLMSNSSSMVNQKCPWHRCILISFFRKASVLFMFDTKRKELAFCFSFFMKSALSIYRPHFLKICTELSPKYWPSSKYFSPPFSVRTLAMYRLLNRKKLELWIRTANASSYYSRSPEWPSFFTSDYDTDYENYLENRQNPQTLLRQTSNTGGQKWTKSGESDFHLRVRRYR